VFLQEFGNHLIFYGDGGFKFLHLLHSRRFLATDVGGIWLSVEERSPSLEEDFLPVVEVHDADSVLFADLRDRHVLDEVLAQDGNLLLTGKIDTLGHWRYRFSDRQTLAHFSSRASRGFKTAPRTISGCWGMALTKYVYGLISYPDWCKLQRKRRRGGVELMKKLRIAVLGSGNIGVDLLIKALRSQYLEPTVLIGRSLASAGMAKAQSLGVPLSAESIGFVESNPSCCDLVFDATSAKDHLLHAPILARLGKKVIDLTPAKVGPMCVPATNMADCLSADNVNMVTCGGQASIPLAYAIGETQKEVAYIEVVSSIASRSAGPATRINLDEYIHTTEAGIQKFSGAKQAKAILNLNPAQPCINMQTTVFAKVSEPNLETLKPKLEEMVRKVQSYVPGYEVIVGPIVENGRMVIMVRVKGLGDYLPAYAGNLDIINCAAIAMAEEYARAAAGA
jgi:acetaldehyde dehydrogenase (acetylating)